MDNVNIFNPQLQTLQSQMQQLQSILTKPAPAIAAQSSAMQISAIQAIPFVEGVNGARAYLKNLPPNSSAAVFDKDEPVFYTLSVDANGIPAPIKVGRFTLEEAPDQTSDNITKKDFDAFRQEIRDAIASIQRRPARQKEATDE